MDFKHKRKYSVNSLAVTAIVIVLLILVNIISVRHFFRVDLTENKQYSISAGTKDLLAKLDDVITIKAFISEDVPSHFQPYVQQSKDGLAEFKANSQGNLNIYFLDPQKDTKLAPEAMTLGIPEVPIQVYEGDTGKAQSQKIFFGLAVLYGDKKEIIPFINTLNLEYDLSSAIRKVSLDKFKTIGFLTGHDEHSFEQSADPNNPTGDYTLVGEALKKYYDLKTVNLSAEITGIDTLIIAGPKKGFSDHELYLIDQFIMKGGNVIFLMDQVNVSNNLQATANSTNLDKLLLQYGVKVNTSLVLDSFPYHEIVTFMQNGGYPFSVNYPFWPKLAKNNFLKENPILATLESIIFPWVSPLEGVTQEGVVAQVLATTSDKAYAQPEPFNLDPNQMPEVQANQLKKLSMIVLLSGKFKSYFANKPVPPAEVALETSDKNKVTATPEVTTTTVKENNGKNQLLVVGDSDFISDSFVKDRYPQNLNFIFNVVDYLTLDPNLIAIRSRGATDRPLLKSLSGAEKSLIRAGGIFLVPALIIIFGVVVSFRRKRKKKEIVTL